MARPKFDPRKLKEQVKTLKASATNTHKNSPYKNFDLLWRPAPGENRIRIVWTDEMLEKFSYYVAYIHWSVGKLSLKTVGETDSFMEMSEAILTKSSKMYNTDQEYAKKLYKQGKTLEPDMRFFVPIVDRNGAPDKTLWYGFGIENEKTLTGAATASDCVNVVNGENYFIDDNKYGFDVIVTYIPSIKQKGKLKNYTGDYSNKDYGETTIRVARNSTPLATDDATISKIYSSIVPFLDIFNIPTYEELKTDLDNYLNAESAMIANTSANTSASTIAATATTNANAASTNQPQIDDVTSNQQTTQPQPPVDYKSKIDGLFG